MPAQRTYQPWPATPDTCMRYYLRLPIYIARFLNQTILRIYTALWGDQECRTQGLSLPKTDEVIHIRLFEEKEMI